MPFDALKRGDLRHFAPFLSFGVLGEEDFEMLYFIVNVLFRESMIDVLLHVTTLQ